MALEHDEVREKLVQVTLELMDAGGLDLVKARTVADRSGVSVGTVYNLYGNVDGLVRAACSRIFTDLNALALGETARIGREMAAAIQAGELADTQKARMRYLLLGLSEVYIAFVAANASRWNGLLTFNRRHPVSAAAEDYQAQQNALIGIIGQCLAGAPFTDAERAVAARTLWSAVHGIVTMNYVGQADPRARAQTWAQIEMLVGYFVEGIFSDGPRG
ncbi:TetR/AcrR family transcriptional regulator [Mariluticola halotolerans]|uniref:TetR/AcrR family transcriptional regulator n=1 Tax=Mariluticola halotolerans TaxID=2909283 RepID=UPI0026E1C2B4|nr:TetR/AcrR family transcriptional regulator [Mariluticola halotolerans]UJQ94516.1 TetR/AcrR family transcriptional regulator [Mariluticola halotolerans]